MRRLPMLALGSFALLAVACSGADEASALSRVTDPSPPSSTGDDRARQRRLDGRRGEELGAGTTGNDAEAKPPPEPPPPPSDLVKCLDTKPYVEGACSATTFPGWPHEAQRCTYASPIGQLSVTVATPSATRVAQWIVDAGEASPAIAHLETADPAQYLRALQVVAAALMIQSGRIFPLSGQVGEDLGGGYRAYPFTKGVSNPCSTGEPRCYCRINSLTRGDLCSYRADKGLESESACRSRVGYSRGVQDAWMNECMGNHARAWTSATNEHIRAQVHVRLRDGGVDATSSGAAVVNALQQGYGLSSGTVSSFCR